MRSSAHKYCNDNVTTSFTVEETRRHFNAKNELVTHYLPCKLLSPSLARIQSRGRRNPEHTEAPKIQSLESRGENQTKRRHQNPVRNPGIQSGRLWNPKQHGNPESRGLSLRILNGASTPHPTLESGAISTGIRLDDADNPKGSSCAPESRRLLLFSGIQNEKTQFQNPISSNQHTQDLRLKSRASSLGIQRKRSFSDSRDSVLDLELRIQKPKQCFMIAQILKSFHYK